MNTSSLKARITENALLAMALVQQAEGLNKLYDGASLRGDGNAADTYRQQLHDLLDQQLDLKSANFVLIRALASDGNSPL